MRIRAVFLGCLIFTLSGCSTNTTRLDSYLSTNSLGFTIRGKGSPTIVFESNLGDSFDVWDGVIYEISKTNQIYAYSRNFSGRHGASSGFTNSRTSLEIANDLRSTLRARKVEPPFVLVGHSYGGLYVLKFAELFPREVAGIVLVDGRPPNFTSRCNQLQLGNCEIPFFFKSLQAPNEQSEIRGLSESENIAPPPEKLGSIPITILASTIPEQDHNMNYQENWVKTQQEFAGSFKSGQFVTALGSRHYIQRDRPDLVVQEIKKIIARAR